MENKKEEKETTTITIKTSTWRKLQIYKATPSETFDDVINFLVEQYKYGKND